jgi:hypothetical protein
MKRPDSEILADLRNVEIGLSPENLTCDGELPQTQVKTKARLLQKKRDSLVQELGREPSFGELWDRKVCRKILS